MRCTEGGCDLKTVRIIGTGSYLPSRVVTNDEIAPRMGSSSEWILSHTGIESRHVAGTEESASSLAVMASRAALEKAGVSPEEVGMIVLATTTSDYGSYPSTACIVQGALGCANAWAFDVSAACSGFVYALELAKCHLLCHPERKALVIGTEVLSRQLDWSDRTCAMLFGDGAGAAVLDVTDIPDSDGFSASVLGSDGSGFKAIVRDAGCRRPLCADPVSETVAMAEVPYLKMDGHEVFAFAVRKLDEVVRSLCSQAEITPESLDKVFAHQANLRIIEAVARRMKLPMDKFYLNLRHVGNTSSASVPLCLDKALRNGELRDGMRIAMAGFGSGLTWAGMLARWPFL